MFNYLMKQYNLINNRFNNANIFGMGDLF